jgi:HEAT repeats
MPVPPAALPQVEQPATDAQKLNQLIDTLRDHLLPSRRQVAAEGLREWDWHQHPEVVEALLQAAREDPAATVRAGCVRCLGVMNVNTEPVLATLQALKADPDPNVRHDAEAVLGILGGQGKTAAKSAGPAR